MKKISKLILSNIQTTLVLLVLFGFNSKLHASSGNKIRYKVEKCDCFGYKEDIPLFLSDISGADTFNITGEGPTKEAAEKQVQNLCVEIYEKFGNSADTSLVSHSGCYIYRKNAKNQWELI